MWRDVLPEQAADVVSVRLALPGEAIIVLFFCKQNKSTALSLFFGLQLYYFSVTD